MSTDITVSKPATYIDSIDYFLDTPASERRKPVMMKNVVFHSAAQRADPNTKLGQLNRIISNCSDCFLLVDMSDTGKFIKMIESIVFKVLEGKAVGIYPKVMINSFVKRLGCTIRPDMMRQIHTSKQSMTPGTLHPMFSHRIPKPMLEFLEYRVQTILEFDFYHMMLDYAIDLLGDDNGLQRTPTYYQCMEHLVDESKPLKQFMTLDDIKPANRTMLVLLAIALIALGIEMLVIRLHKRKPKRRPVIRPTLSTLKQPQLMNKVVTSRLIVVKKVTKPAKKEQAIDVMKGDLLLNQGVA